MMKLLIIIILMLLSLNSFAYQAQISCDRHTFTLTDSQSLYMRDEDGGNAYSFMAMCDFNHLAIKLNYFQAESDWDESIEDGMATEIENADAHTLSPWWHALSNQQDDKLECVDIERELDEVVPLDQCTNIGGWLNLKEST